MTGSREEDHTRAEVTAQVIQFPLPEQSEVRCSCGEAWYVLVGDPNVAPHGAVVVTPDARIIGYHGALRCLSCGQPGPSAPAVEG